MDKSRHGAIFPKDACLAVCLPTAWSRIPEMPTSLTIVVDRRRSYLSCRGSWQVLDLVRGGPRVHAAGTESLPGALGCQQQSGIMNSHSPPTRPPDPRVVGSSTEAIAARKSGEFLFISLFYRNESRLMKPMYCGDSIEGSATPEPSRGAPDRQFEKCLR